MNCSVFLTALPLQTQLQHRLPSAPQTFLPLAHCCTAWPQNLLGTHRNIPKPWGSTGAHKPVPAQHCSCPHPPLSCRLKPHLGTPNQTRGSSLEEGFSPFPFTHSAFIFNRVKACAIKRNNIPTTVKCPATEDKKMFVPIHNSLLSKLQPSKFPFHVNCTCYMYLVPSRTKPHTLHSSPLLLLHPFPTSRRVIRMHMASRDCKKPSQEHPS